MLSTKRKQSLKENPKLQSKTPSEQKLILFSCYDDEMKREYIAVKQHLEEL